MTSMRLQVVRGANKYTALCRHYFHKADTGLTPLNKKPSTDTFDQEVWSKQNSRCCVWCDSPEHVSVFHTDNRCHRHADPGNRTACITFHLVLSSLKCSESLPHLLDTCLLVSHTSVCALTACWSDCRAPQRNSSRLAQENNQPNRCESLDALSQPANATEANVEQLQKSLQASRLR